MALERQLTFETGVAQAIDTPIEKYLRENEIDPAAIQLIIDSGTGKKTATLTYATRQSLKEAYEKQGRKYTDSDAVTYCHVKDIITTLNGDLDKEVNDFVADEKISIISLSRYFTPANKGAFIFYIDLEEQKIKIEEKQKEIEKTKEELSKKFATEAVKDTELEQNDTVDKYVDAMENFGKSTEEVATNISDGVKNLLEQKEDDTKETEKTTSEEIAIDELAIPRELKEKEKTKEQAANQRKKIFGKNK